MVFCLVLTLMSTVSSTFGISNSGAQIQTEPPSTIQYNSPWNNNKQISSASTNQPLCKAGICTQPANTTLINSAKPTTKPQNTVSSSATTSTNNVQPTTIQPTTTKPQNTVSSSATTSTNNVQPTTIQPTTTKPQNTVSSSATTSTNNVQPTTKTLTQTFTTNKTPTLFHSFVSSYIVGADRFRFIKSYWTSSDVAPPNLLNGYPTANTPCPGLENSPFSLQPQALNTEVDTDEGYATLAVILQYQGVAALTGIAAGLELPSGVQAQLPLETDRNNYNIALSNFVGAIIPGQAITLCFPLNVLQSAKVQVPVLGPLALHFLRSHSRMLTDTIDSTKMESAMRMLQFANEKNTTTFNNNFNTPPSPTQPSLTFTYNNEFDRNIPFDYINQVIPVIFKVTGREILDVSLPPQPISAFSPSVPSKQLASTPGFANITVSGLEKLLSRYNAPSSSGSGSSSMSSPTNWGKSRLLSATGGSGSIPDPNPKKSPSKNVTSAGVTPCASNCTKLTHAVNITFSNIGDVSLHDLVAVLSTNVSSLVTAAAVMQTYPLGIQGPSTFHILSLGPRSSRTISVNVTTAIGCATVEPITVSSTYTNSIGLRVSQKNTVLLQIQANTWQAAISCPVPTTGVVSGIALPPGAVAPQVIVTANSSIGPYALSQGYANVTVSALDKFLSRYNAHSQLPSTPSSSSSGSSSKPR
jgi:hypothetical protein